MNSSSYQLPLERCADPLLLVDGQGAVLWANPSAAQFLSLQSAPRPSLAHCLSETDLSALLATEGFVSFELTVRLPSGNSVPQQTFALDISGLEPADRALLVLFKSRALQSSNLAAREEFLGQVAHDLKNPLGAIFGFADALLEGREPLTETQRSVLSRIRATSMRCTDMVRNYQVLAELPKIQGRSAGPAVELNSAVRAACEYAWRGERGEASLVLSLQNGAINLPMDRGQLDRIITNLISNAIRYSGPNGRVTIKTWTTGASAAMLVNNSGPPIPSDEISGIFSRHVRGSNSRGIPGSGLGLFIIKELIARAGGRVEVESNEQSGTTFTVTLPMAAAHTG